MSVLLQVKNLKTHFFNRNHVIPAVDGIDLNIEQGQTVALVGESGAGKSIASLSILKLIPNPPGKIVEGEILFNGTDLVSLSEKQMCKVRGNDISMIFQDPMTSLNPVLTIGEQIIEVLVYHKKMTKREAKEQAIELLKLVGFSRAEDLISEYPHRLSGGMRQRVMIAIAMSCNPKLLIADEPTTALDVTIQAQILDLMRDLKERTNTSILIITHDLGVVSEIADKVLVMYCGQVVEEAPVEELFSEPLHPYTVGLIDSIPTLDSDTDRLIPIEGHVPSPEQFPKGCRFAPRCPHAFERCFTETPDLITMNEKHSTRCFLYEGKGRKK
ncbi:ABC transporter ATP-binding protein [Bacillus niameyensis]|uniref:ABC transporter ATP-binding protein n=1 Tax=Bacillus niameyensis TaxID=1522308 RepID=UPI000782EC22|nr:ABC transporter ATP-binding protein [Bacillus niameyensis]